MNLWYPENRYPFEKMSLDEYSWNKYFNKKNNSICLHLYYFNLLIENVSVFKDKYDDISKLIVSFIIKKKYDIQDYVDVQDIYGNWYVSIIINIIPNLIHVHFIGWHNKYREWININDNKIKPFGTYTGGNIYFPYIFEKKITNQLTVGDWVTEDVTNYKIQYRIIHNNLLTKDISINNKSDIFFVLQGEVIYIGEKYIIIQNYDKMYKFGNMYSGWRIIKKKINWICPSCKFLWKEIIYFCNKCGYTHGFL